MKKNQIIGFVLSLIATGCILHLLNYSEKQVSLLRMEYQLRQDPLFQEEISARCHTLLPREESDEEKFFLQHLIPDAGNGAAPSCVLVVRSSARHRFHLRTYWNYIVAVYSTDGHPLAERSFHVEFPRPLCFLPIAAFLLALVFELPHWGLVATVLSYLLLVAGGNLIRAMSLVFRSGELTCTTDQTFQGLLLIALWLSLYRSAPHAGSAMQRPSRLWEKILSRGASVLIGLWNPAVYTLMGRMLYPLRSRLLRLLPFLDAQLLVAALSLYLLNLDVHNPLGFFHDSLLLPRYFTFAALLFFGINYWTSRSQRETILWSQPHVWRPALFVIVIELLAWKVTALTILPKLTRVGLALVASELVWPAGLAWRPALKQFFPWAGALFVASFLTVVSNQGGVIDLFQVLWEPRVHPNALVIFTFIAGLALGFLTGNFSATFFALFPVILKPHETDLVRAALLDGILAGTMLSPFSLLNLIPSVQFGTSLQTLIVFRFKQLAFPLGIAGAIYAVSAINSVAILRPVTFVFLCLVAVAFQLKKSAWKVGKFSIEPPMTTTGA